MYTYVHICMYISRYVYSCFCVFLCRFVYVCAFLYLYTCSHVHICIDTCMYICTYTCIYTCIYTHMYTDLILNKLKNICTHQIFHPPIILLLERQEITFSRTETAPFDVRMTSKINWFGRENMLLFWKTNISRPTQSIIYVPLHVNRFQKSILLIVQYKYLKSCSGDFILQNLILHKIMRTAFITQCIWGFHFHLTNGQVEMFCTTVAPAPKGHLGGASPYFFWAFHFFDS